MQPTLSKALTGAGSRGSLTPGRPSALGLDFAGFYLPS